MIIELDTEVLKSLSLTANEYVKLGLLCSGEVMELTFTEHEKLLRLKLIQKEGYSTISATDKALQMFNLERKTQSATKDDWEKYFLIFWDTYPRLSGSRVNRTDKSNTRQAINCRERFKKSAYFKIENCQNIIKGLQNYIKSFAGKEEFITGIEVFLNQNTWEKYYEMSLFGNNIIEPRL